MSRILSVSRNPRLLAARNDALALAGYSVVSPKHPEDALLLFAQESFDAVIIGHSVEGATREGLIKAIREARPSVPILFAYAGDPTQEEPLADVSVDVTAGTTPIVIALEELLSKAKAE
ncbi:MAG: hypothetical protein JOY79_08280 [Acidobacteriaceae bacterium]|nr:hypothetical protein [Acidobacteriaceae bacterium]